MIGASKILTVSYGTFSCTLEGFEEPFSTMKAIAEYFRDLAADDRYFGAEPPTPDAEMLHRIAEREIQRRVEAKINEHGVVLRVQASPDQTEQRAAQRTPAGMAVAEVAPAAAMIAADAVAGAAVVPDDISVEDAQDVARAVVSYPAVGEPDSVAAKLSRLRAAVEQARLGAPEPKAAPIYAEDLYAEDLMAAPQHFAIPMVAFAEEGVAAPAVDLALAGDLDAAEDVAVVQDVAAPDAVPVAEPDLAWLAELQADASEPQVTAAQLIAAANEPEGMAGPDADDAVGAVPELSAETDGDLSAMMERLNAGFEPENDPVEDPSAAAWVLAEIQAANRDEAVTHSLLAKFAVEAEDEDLHAPAGLPDTDEAPVDPPVSVETDGARRPRARVIKVRREDAPVAATELTADVTAGQVDPILADIKASMGDTGLSGADEDDLLNELADVARELQATDGDDAAEPVLPEAAGAAPAESDLRPSEGRAILETAAEPQEDAISRLFEQTNTELEGTENRRRLSAIAHLKAAVAATEAEKEANPDGNGLNEPTEIDRYRDDLAKAVRPRRPELGGLQTRRSETSGPANRRPMAIGDRPPPLMLVSEQRIDRPSAADAMAIRPRRVMTSALMQDDEDMDTDMDEDGEDTGAILADSKSFAEFAERIGATELGDLLEAAAAYAATVEGRPSFSRPQIMRQVQDFGPEDQYSREDGLRSFGMLLRQGKIQKVKRGQFAIAKTSRFIPEARRIGQ